MVRPTIAGLLVLMLVVAAGCQDRAITVPGALAVPEGMAPARTLLPGQFEEPCGTVVTMALLSAAGERVGEVTVWNGPTEAYARLTAPAGWEFIEVRVHGARRPDQFPRTGGAVDPARFRFGGAVSPPAAEVVIEAMHLDNPYGVVPGEEVVLAAFARLRPVGGGSVVEAWAEGTPFQAGEPATHFAYTLQECPLLDPSTITGGLYHSCGLTRSGTAYCWGWNFFGQLGNGSFSDRLTPSPVAGGHTFVAIAGGYEHTCGITVEDRAYCWGQNFKGQLGDGTYEHRNAPTPVLGGPEFVGIAGGYEHTCAVTPQGRAYCWGWNNQGQLGDGTKVPRAQPGPVVGALVFAQVAIGRDDHTCGLTTDDRAYCWGRNVNGQLGDGTTKNRLVPTAVAGDEQFVVLALGAGHSCGITSQNRGYCWGSNGFGSLGDGTNVSRRIPTAIVGEHEFAQLAAGGSHTCGRALDGAGFCWGYNFWGQVGDGTTIGRNRPTAIVGELVFARIGAGGLHSCGITTENVAYCWGNNELGQVGDGTTDDRHVPTPVFGWPDLMSTHVGAR